MEKKEKLQNLLKRLNILKSQLPQKDLRGILEQENKSKEALFNYLENFSKNIEKYKREHDLSPIVSTIDKIQKDLTKFKDEMSKTGDSISELFSTADIFKNSISEIESKLTVLNQKELNKLDSRINEIQSLIQTGNSESKTKNIEYQKSFQDFNNKITSLFDELGKITKTTSESSVSYDKRFSESESKLNKLVSSFEESRNEFLNRLNRIGGGNANRQINVKSSVMSSRYTDINFANGGGIVWTASDDTTNKRVNITASVISAGGGGSGTPGGNNTEIQFNDGGSFGGSSTLTWNKSTSILSATAVVVTGTSGTGYITLPNQSPNPPSVAAGNVRLHGFTTQGFTRLEQDNESATNVILGRDLVVVARNTSGGDLAKGDVVYITGSTGNVPNIAKAQANTTATLPAVFVVIDPITNGSFGQIMRNGILTNFDTSAFSAGAPVWLSTTVAGGLTATRPSGLTNLVQRVGTILVSGVGNGSMDVNIAPAILNMESGTVSSIWQGSSIVGTVTTTNTLLVPGSTSGNVRILSASVAGNWTMTLPSDDGTPNQVLTTDGNGITRWASVAATGGSGITRTTSIITANTLADETASIDRVYIGTGLAFTLPDATGNTNRYTVKNTTSSILVTAVGGDTIDGSASVLMALPNLSHDFISDNVNWNII